MARWCVLFVNAIAILFMTACARPPQPPHQVLITPEYYLGMDLSDQRWRISKKAPEFLVEEMAEHLGHELEKDHPELSPAQIRNATEKRLIVDELFIYNQRSHARMVIDFSSLREGEIAPSRRTVATSADYAGQSLANEEGITDVFYKTSRCHLPGAEFAYRLEAEYKHHQEPIKLVGIVGFADPYWFYFYFTDPLVDENDLPSMEKLIDSFILLPTTLK